MIKAVATSKISLLIALCAWSFMSSAEDRTATTVTATVQPYMSVTAVTPTPSFIITPTSVQTAQYIDTSWTVSSNSVNQQYIVTTVVDNADSQGAYMSLQNPPPGTFDPNTTRVHYQINYYPCGTSGSQAGALTSSGPSSSGPATFVSNIINANYGVFTVCPSGQTGDLRFILTNTAINPYPMSGTYLGQVTLIASPYN